jgi:HK97 family phage prohead protease
MDDTAPHAGTPEGLVTCAAEVTETDAEKRSFRFVCSTPAVDSYDEMVEQSWLLDRYKANPVVVLFHNTRDLPIATASDVGVKDGKLAATITVVDDDMHPQAKYVARQLAKKTLRGISVGFRPREVRREKRDDKEVFVLAQNELYELSLTPVPANPETLMRMRARAASAPVPVTRGIAAIQERHMADSKGAEPQVAQLGRIELFLPLAAELGVAAHGDDDARAKLTALAREALEVRTALGTKTPAETAGKLSTLGAEAAKVPALEATLKTAAEAEAKRAELERARHLDALCAGKPELRAFRASLELHAKHDWDGFVKQYPVAAGTDPQLTALKAENAALRTLAMGAPLARLAGEQGAAPEPPSTPAPPRDHVADCRARAAEIRKASPNISALDALLQASRELKSAQGGAVRS